LLFGFSASLTVDPPVYGVFNIDSMYSNMGEIGVFYMKSALFNMAFKRFSVGISLFLRLLLLSAALLPGHL
jgi:hypothetical protein